MGFFNYIVGGKKGLHPQTVDVEGMHLVNTAQVTTTYTVGQVACLDWSRASAETLNATAGATGSALVNLITPIASQLQGGTFLVPLNSVAKGTDDTWRLRGYCRVSVVSGSAAAAAIGALCAAAVGLSVESTPASQTPGAKLIFRLDTATTTTTAALRSGWFDGE